MDNMHFVIAIIAIVVSCIFLKLEDDENKKDIKN